MFSHHGDCAKREKCEISNSNDEKEQSLVLDELMKNDKERAIQRESSNIIQNMFGQSFCRLQ